MTIASIPSPEIFKAYDIRGIVGKTLTQDSAYAIGQAIGSEALQRKQTCIVAGRDGRLSGQIMANALIEGLLTTGINVVDIGEVPTPIAYFAAHHLNTGSVVMVTGSHNPPEYNGFKIMLGWDTLHGAAITDLCHRIIEKRLTVSTKQGELTHADLKEAYISRILSDVKLARPLHLPLHIAIDCGNGVAGGIAPELYRRLGCVVTELFCEVDGHFPNHHPDPSKPENLKDLIKCLQTGDAELGLAFDGDGDRLGVVTQDGEIIFPDRQLMLFAKDVLSRAPHSNIIYDVKCTRHLAGWIRQHGGQALMWNTGHALIKAKLRETGAALAGEMSGHIFFKERWYGFDDGLYAGARLLEILSKADHASDILKALPNSLSTPELNLQMEEGEPHALIAKMQKTAVFTDAQEVITIDGLRVEYADGFGLARASNTTPVVVLRFEADNPAALARIQADFRRVLNQARAGMNLPF